MSIIKLYIATTIDGYIAKPDGNLDWLTSLPEPESGDYGYQDLLNSIESIIMGRITYEEVLGFGIEWPYNDFKTYIVTNDSKYMVKTPETFVLNADFKDSVTDMKSKAEKDIWLVGGGKLISAFLENNLIDQMILTIVPKILGEGIRLFPGRTKESDWTLTEVKPFNTGLVNLTYEKIETE
jgi:dihydrofolate reductase